MLFPGNLSTFLWSYDNYGANPSATPGTSVIPGASNAEGSWTAIASSANIANDVYRLFLWINTGSTAANAKNHLLDIGVDPAGGTSYTAVVSNLICGGSPPLAGVSLGGRHFEFPLFIKAGSSVAVRIQGSNATAGTVRVAAKFYGHPSAPETMPHAQFSETLGTITSSNGVSFTPGTAADGTAVSLGTTSKALWWWQGCYQINNGTVTVRQVYIDFGYGPTGSQRWFKRLMHVGNTSEAVGDTIESNLLFAECYCPLPAGTELWVRGRGALAPDTGFNAVIVGFGG